jgi:2-C-methyl-D-erythritol 4-phosphate cytidylyltransferase/2-C-methyl-D-erythritol 2,4-cyclodiphosphate synthase
VNAWAVILAAGSGSRMAAAGLASRKQFLPLGGRPLYWASARTLARVPRIAGLVLAFPSPELDARRAELETLLATEPLGLPCVAVAGGERRQDSVSAALAALPRDCAAVLVHDAARPFASAALASRLLDALAAGEQAAIPGIPLKDTVKRVAHGRVADTPPRADLVAVQTPQAFALSLLKEAHAAAASNGWDVTDDAMLVERLGRPVAVVPGEEDNVKITTPEDLRLLAGADSTPLPCTGWGYDVHKYGAGRPMKLGGVPIPGGPEVVAHSDGDVLLHAVTDAVLGCLGAGDIGQHFPDTDKANEGLESAIFLNEVMQMADRVGLVLTHADVTVIAQVPKLAPFRDQIRDSLSRLLRLPVARVNVKFTTEEGLGFTGQKKGIKAAACVSGLLPPA